MIASAQHPLGDDEIRYPARPSDYRVGALERHAGSERRRNQEPQRHRSEDQREAAYHPATVFRDVALQYALDILDGVVKTFSQLDLRQSWTPVRAIFMSATPMSGSATDPDSGLHV